MLTGFLIYSLICSSCVFCGFITVFLILKNKRKIHPMMASLIGIIYSAANSMAIVALNVYVIKNMFLNYVLLILIFIPFSFAFFGHPARKSFSCFSGIIPIQIVYAIGMFIANKLTNLFATDFKLTLSIVFLIIAFIYCAILTIFLGEKLNSIASFHFKRSKWIVGSIYPFLATFTMNIFVSTYSLDDMVFTSRSNQAFLFVYIISVVISYYTCVKVIFMADKNKKNEMQIKYSKQLIESNEQYNKLMQTKIQDTRFLKHDLRHHLNIIQLLLVEKKYDEISEYINNLDSRIQSIKFNDYTKNNQINLILNSSSIKFYNYNISLYTDIKLPEKINIDSVDLTIMCANLFENAAEACTQMETGKRFINIKSKVIGNKFIFMIENSYNGIVKASGDSYKSTKADSRGTGIKSVRDIVEKYNGDIDISHNDKTFSVMIKVDIPEENIEEEK